MQRQNPNPYQQQQLQEQHQQQQVQQQYSTQEYSHSTQEQHQQRISRTEQHVQRSQITTQQRGQSVCLSAPVGPALPCHALPCHATPELSRLRTSTSCIGQWDSHRGFRIPTVPFSCYRISIRYRQSPFLLMPISL